MQHSALDHQRVIVDVHTMVFSAPQPNDRCSSSREQIDHAMKSTDRLVAALKTPVVVDINYDTLVIEGGVLHIYPDVYGRDTNTVSRTCGGASDRGSGRVASR